MNFRLMFKLSTLPWRRSFTLQLLIGLAIAQLFLGAWIGGAIDQEIRRTEKFAETARWITIQLKEDKTDAIKSLLEGEFVTIEELSTEKVLDKMETEEPDVVQTVRAMGKEGLQLVPSVMLVRGVVSESILEKIKLRPEASRVDVSPVHHSKLRSFYHHLQIEMRIALIMVLFLMLVILIGLQRIEMRDLREVKENLLMWGSGHLQSRLPIFFSLFLMITLGGILSIVEWETMRRLMWKANPFLGELSIDRTLHFPFLIFIMVFASVFLFISVLSFSGRKAEE